MQLPCNSTALIGISAALLLLLWAPAAQARYGVIVIEMATDPAGGTGTFVDDIKAPHEFTIGDGESKTFVKTLRGPREVTLSSSVPAPLASIDCDDPDGLTTVDLATRTAFIDLEEFETVTCRFTTSGEVQQSGSDLWVTKSDTADPVRVGEVISYTITVGNQGPEAASNVLVSDRLPPGASLVSAPGCLPNAAGFACALASLPAGARHEITVQVRAPEAPGVIVNQVSVRAATSTASDPDPGNDAAEEATTVVVADGAHVVIRKASVPVGGQRFAFEGDFGDFLLDDGQSAVFSATPGVHEVREGPQTDGWAVSGIDCSSSGGSDAEVLLPEGVVRIDLAPNDMMTCTFYNELEFYERFGCERR